MDLKEVKDEKIFKECYYETDYTSFTKLFNIDSTDYGNDQAQYKFNLN